MNAGEWLEKATCAVLIGGQIVGTAWLVSDEGHLLTAGHVLGTEQPVDEVEVQFVEDVARKATRVEWRYDEEQYLDFAVLKLREPIKRRCLPVSLVKKVEAGRFRLCGYGTNLKYRALSSSQGIFSGSIYTNDSFRTHLFRLQSSDLGVEGNSGGAVFSDELQAVVAIQTEAARSRIGPESEALLAMPLYRVAQFWEPLQTLAEEKMDESAVEGLVTPQRGILKQSARKTIQAQPRDKPFYFNQPVKPADFIGRWGLVDEVVSDLCRAVPDSWAVIGGRRFGKSSVLKVIESRLFERLAASARGQRHIFPLRVDLKGCETKTTGTVYACLLRRLHEVLENRSFSVMNWDASRYSHAIRPYDAESISFQDFEDSLKQLTQYFEQHHGPLRLVFLLDEVEAVTRFAWHETLFDQLRYLIYDSNLVEHIRLVLTGSARVIESRQAGSPLLNAVNIRYLSLFSRPDMQQLMARGGQMPDEAAASVQNQSGGHPFIAQYLLSNLWTPQHGLTEATAEQVEKVARKMRRHRNHDMRGWWEAIGQNGQHAYAVLAEHEEWIDEDRLIREFQIKDVDSGLTALCYHGIVARDESLPPQYRVAGELFRRWYLRNEKGEAVANNNEAQPVPPPDVQEDSTFPTIENPKHFQLPAKADLILQEMFKTCKRVIITHDFSALGYSGSWVIRVHPHRSGPELPVVVKIASRSLIEKEAQAYKKYVENKWSGIAQLRGELVYHGNLAGCVYPLVGDGVFDVKSLRQYCLSAEVDDVRFVLAERLFRIIKEGILRPSRNEFDFALRASYDVALPVNLLIEPRSLSAEVPQVITPDKLPRKPLEVNDPVRLEGFIIKKVDLRHKAITLNLPLNKKNSYRSRLRITEALEADPALRLGVGEVMPPVEGVVLESRRSRFNDELKKVFNLEEPPGKSVTLPGGRALPNPLQAIPAILDEIRHLKFNSIHGDLNLENVLVDPDVRDVRLIDFAEARQDHVLHDFLRLETEVVSKLIPVALAEAGLSPDVICPFYEELHAATFGNGDGKCSYPALEKPFVILVAIREAASEGVYDQNKASQEYYPCLMLYLVGALRFKNLDRSAKQSAFWGAATILKLMNPSPDTPLHAKKPYRWNIRLLVGAMGLLITVAIIFNFLPPWIAIWYNNQGAKAYHAGNLPSAQAHYEGALWWNPDNAESHYNLGALYEAQDEFEKAHTEYRLAIEGDLEIAYHNLVRLYIRRSEHDSALFWLQQGLERTEDKQARADLEELSHQLAVLYNNQGAKAYEAGDLPSAQAHYEQAIQLHTDYAEAHYNLGGVYEDLLDVERAQQEYQLALEGGLDAAYNNQARLYILSEEYKAAVTLLLRGLEQAEDDDVKYDMLKNLGWTRLAQKRYAEADTRLQAAMTLKPNRAPAHCLLAQVREAQNALSQAEEKAAQAHQAWNNCLTYADSRNPDEDEWLEMARDYLEKEE